MALTWPKFIMTHWEYPPLSHHKNKTKGLSMTNPKESKDYMKSTETLLNEYTESLKKEVPQAVLSKIYHLINHGQSKLGDYTIGQILELLDFLKQQPKNKHINHLIRDILNHHIDAESFSECHFLDWPVWGKQEED